MAFQPRPRPAQSLIDLHENIGALNARLERLADPGETLAETCMRLGSQHPIVRQRDYAIRVYRRAASVAQTPFYSGAPNRSRYFTTE